MKTVILCGGLGTRLSEETVIKPKPMVTIGDRPILWHIMNGYAHHGFKEFVLALGYKGDVIKDYFLNFNALSSDFDIDLSTGKLEFARTPSINWKVSLMDTGEETMTGGRLLRLRNKLKGEGTFMATYGDGVSNVDIKKLLDFHKSHGKLVTVTAVRPIARFGGIEFQGDQIKSFSEKPEFGEGWINGGFFVMEPGVFEYLKDDTTILERSPMEGLVKDKQIVAYKHQGYWQCMDTVRDRQILEEKWAKGAPWKVWD